MCTTVEGRDISLQCRTDRGHANEELVAQRAMRVLEADPYFRGRARQLEFQVHNGVIVVRGRVPSFFLKQILQTLLNRVEGVEQVENHVEVTPPQGVTH